MGTAPSRWDSSRQALYRPSNMWWLVFLGFTCFAFVAPSFQELAADDVAGGSILATESAEYPPGKLGEAIRLGKLLVEQTSEHPLTAPWVGNSLNCTSCHLDAGQHPEAASFIGVASAYPAFSPREDAVITLEERISHCFTRSQNGTKPPYGETVLVSIAAYITWLSRETPIRMNPNAPLGPNRIKPLSPGDHQASAERGRELYAARCASCHAGDGSGSDEGPPVWGENSYNDGAGLSKLPNLASWLKVAMPLDDADLSDAEAFDIAAYLTSQPRPSFSP